MCRKDAAGRIMDICEGSVEMGQGKVDMGTRIVYVRKVIEY